MQLIVWLRSVIKPSANSAIEHWVICTCDRSLSVISSKNSWRPNNCKNAEREFSPSLRVRNGLYSCSGLQSNYTCLNCTELPLCCAYCLPCDPILSHPSVMSDPPLAPPSHCCFSQESVLGAISIPILASRGETCNESPSFAVLPGTGTLRFHMKPSAERMP